MPDELTLLRDYVEKADQNAFSELVHRRVDFVYSAAWRQVGRDAHLAQDVTQGVFLALARNAPGLLRRPTLGGWLYTTTRFLAAKAVRTHRRWQTRAQEAQVMNELRDEGRAREPDWEQLRPVLDTAMHELNEREREAILLRYFESRPFAEIAQAFALTENAARMRVERAMEKLRAQLARRGVTSTTAALALVLSTQTISAAPPGLAATAALAGTVAAATAGTELGILGIMSMTKLKIAAVSAAAAILAVGVGSFHAGKYASAHDAPDAAMADGTAETISRLRSENARLNAATAQQGNEISALRDESRQLNAQLRRVQEATQPARSSVSTGVDAGRGAEPSERAMDRLRMLTDLHEGGVLKAEIKFFDRAGKISDGFATLFDLTAVERDGLQQAVDGVRQQLDAAMLAGAAVSRDSDGSVVIDIPPATSGAELYDQFFDAFGRTLGAERNAAFFALGAGEMENAFDRFGAEQRRLTVRREPAQADGTPVFSLRDERESASGTSNYGYNPMSRAKLDESMGAIARLLPGDF